MPMDTKALTARLSFTKVLVVDDEPNMRKVVRTMLMSMGVRSIYEAADAPTGLEAIRALVPEVVVLDWEMPGIDGAEFMRKLRAPDSFPYPDVPVIMLTGHGERSRVLAAMRLGVNEFLLKPVSAKALRERLIAVLANPRPMVKQGEYYGPMPRAGSSRAANDDVHTLFLIN